MATSLSISIPSRVPALSSGEFIVPATKGDSVWTSVRDAVVRGGMIPVDVRIVYCADKRVSNSGGYVPKVGARCVTVAFRRSNESGNEGILYGATIFHRKTKGDTMNRRAHRATAIMRLMHSPIFVADPMDATTEVERLLRSIQFPKWKVPMVVPPKYSEISGFKTAQNIVRASEVTRSPIPASRVALAKYLRKCVHQFGVKSR